MVLHQIGRTAAAALPLCSDEEHEELEGADQSQGGPRAYQGTCQAMRQVGAGRGHDPGGQAPRGE